MSALERVLNLKSKRFTTSEDRQEAYLALCEHIRKGQPVDSFHFAKDGKKLSGPRILDWVDERPHEFEYELFQANFAEGYAHWLNIVDSSALGKNQYANTASIQMRMRNTYGWEKKDKQEEDKRAELVIQKMVYRAAKEIEIQENT